MKRKSYLFLAAISLAVSLVVMTTGCSANDQLLLNPPVDGDDAARSVVDPLASTSVAGACQEWTAANWLHAMYGRATKTTTGSWWNQTVTYTAKGSGEIMPGGSYSQSTLNSSGDGVYHVGVCEEIIIPDGPFESPAQTIFSGEEMPHTENIVLTDNGRMFVAGADLTNGGKLYEITLAGGAYSFDIVHTAPVGGFTGLTVDGNILYATSQNVGGYTGNSAVTFHRIDASSATVQVQSRTLTGIKQPNGMTVDLQGRIYISDSAATGSWFTPSTAPVFRLDSFNAEPVAWLDPQYAKGFPNGIDMNADCSVMYYADKNVVYSIQITAAGDAGTVAPFYTTGTDKIFDDLAVTDEFLALAEIKSPASASGSSVPGAVVIVNMDKQLVQSIAPDRLSEPSDVLYHSGTGELWVTDYFKGGLLRISPAE